MEVEITSHGVWKSLSLLFQCTGAGLIVTLFVSLSGGTTSGFGAKIPDLLRIKKFRVLYHSKANFVQMRGGQNKKKFFARSQYCIFRRGPMRKVCETSIDRNWSKARRIHLLGKLFQENFKEVQICHNIFIPSPQIPRNFIEFQKFCDPHSGHQQRGSV